MLDAAIVGLGWWGQELVKAIEGSPLLRFVRAVTLEPSCASAFVEARSMMIGTSYDAVLQDPSVQAVVLATPHSLHRAQVEAAAAAGKHVFCEKPFALTRADARCAIAACRSAGVALGVGHNRRLWPSVKALRELLVGGTLGTFMHAEGTYSHDWLAACPSDHWRNASEETRAGGMTGMGIHLLDCFSFIVGPMQKISALSTSRTLSLPAGDTTAALIKFANGGIGTLSTTLQTSYVWRLAIYGSDGWAESTSETRLSIYRSGRAPETLDLASVNHIRENLESFATAALGGAPFHIDEQSVVHTVAVLNAVFDSVDEQGAWKAVDLSSLDCAPKAAVHHGHNGRSPMARANPISAERHDVALGEAEPGALG
jgi:predicted dehydrogenase